MKRITTLITLLLALTIAIQAAPTFSVSAPQRVAVGQKFPVTFRLRDGEGTGIKVPQINGCTLLYGPATSTSQSYQVYNGQMTSSSTVDYTYYYRADKEGTFTVGEASINVDGKTLTTKSATITVVAGAEPQQGGGRNQGQTQRQAPVNIDDITSQSADRSVSANDVFVRIILSKSKAYEQEAIDCTIKLYTKYGISSFFPTKQPSFDGFLIDEVNFQSSINQEETYNGQRYHTALLKKCIIFPQKAGKLTITSGNYDLTVVQFDQVNMGFFTVQNPREREIKITSNSASVEVMPLPEPRPAGFTGAVGKFSIDSRLVGNSFRTNDPATLIYTIKGTGNIKYIKEPVIDFPSEFEQYTPKTDIESHVTGSTVTGTMTVEYTFVPQSVGDYRIGSDDFVYFDPSSREYITLNTPSYDIKVAKGVSSASSDTERKDIVAKNNDILYIHLGDKNLSMDHTPVVYTWWFWMLFVLLAVGVVVAVILNRKHISRMADVSGRRLAKAGKEARKRLSRAREYMEKGQSDEFYAELLNAITGYLSDKLQIPVSQFSRQTIESDMKNYGASPELINSFIDTLDKCEMARYTPMGTPEEVSEIYRSATDSINQMENIKSSTRK